MYNNLIKIMSQYNLIVFLLLLKHNKNPLQKVGGIILKFYFKNFYTYLSVSGFLNTQIY